MNLQSTSALGGKQILIAEQEERFAQALTTSLQKAGFTALVVKDGEKALEAIRNNPPDLVLLEVLTPKILGTEVCFNIKKNSSSARIPVILMSKTLKEMEGLSIPEQAYRADDYLLKPFTADMLVTKITTHLQKSKDVSRQVERESYDVDDFLTMPDEEANPNEQEASADFPYFRFNPRAPLNISVDYRNADLFFSSPTMNISKGGIFIQTDKPLPIGKVISLQFTLPDHAEPVKGYGRVVWVEKPGNDRPSGMGIRFKDFTTEDLKTVYAYVRRLRQLVR